MAILGYHFPAYRIRRFKDQQQAPATHYTHSLPWLGIHTIEYAVDRRAG